MSNPWANILRLNQPDNIYLIIPTFFTQTLFILKTSVN